MEREVATDSKPKQGDGGLEVVDLGFGKRKEREERVFLMKHYSISK